MLWWLSFYSCIYQPWKFNSKDAVTALINHRPLLKWPCPLQPQCYWFNLFSSGWLQKSLAVFASEHRAEPAYLRDLFKSDKLLKEGCWGFIFIFIWHSLVEQHLCCFQLLSKVIPSLPFYACFSFYFNFSFLQKCP